MYLSNSILIRSFGSLRMTSGGKFIILSPTPFKMPTKRNDKGNYEVSEFMDI